MKPKENIIFSQFAKGRKKGNHYTGDNCVIYTRVSSRDQLDNTSLQTQIVACREYALQKGFEILAEFGGTYESAKSDKDRIEFKRMLSFLNGRTKVNKIIVYSLDRFSRTGGGAISIIENLKKRGIDVHAVTQPADTDTASGKLMQQINLIFSNFDNSLRRQKTIGGMIARMKDGYCCGVAPLGYLNVRQNGKKVVEPDGEKSKLVKLAFKWKAKEKLSNTEVQKRLKARGWNISKQTLSQMLKNPFYCGLITHSLLEGEVVKGKHQPLVSKQLFLTANEVNAKFSRKGGNNPEKAEVSLKRFLKCKKCGEPLRGYIVKAKGLWYYKCTSKGCRVNRSAVKIHELFKNELNQYTLSPEFHAPVKAKFKDLLEAYFADQLENIGKLKTRLSTLETKLDKLESKYLFDELPQALYEKHRGKLDIEKEQIQKEIDRTGKQISNFDEMAEKSVQYASKMSLLWENGDYTERQKVQKLVFPDGVSC